MSNYTMKDRWVATGLVDRLIYESGTTFHAEDALALLALLPGSVAEISVRTRLGL
jgi:hypothetical protein